MYRWPFAVVVVSLFTVSCGGERLPDPVDTEDDVEPVERPVRWIGPEDPGAEVRGVMEVVQSPRTTGTFVAAWSIRPAPHALLTVLMEGTEEACEIPGDRHISRPLDASLHVRVDEMTWELDQAASGFWRWNSVVVDDIAGSEVEPMSSGLRVQVPPQLAVTDRSPAVTQDGTRLTLDWEPGSGEGMVSASIRMDDGPQVRCVLDNDGHAVIEGPVFEDPVLVTYLGLVAGGLWELPNDGTWALMTRVELYIVDPLDGE